MAKRPSKKKATESAPRRRFTKRTVNERPVRAERTVSRAAKRPEPEDVKIEKLGVLQRWVVPSAPYADQKAARAAFIGGFLARTDQWNTGTISDGVPQRFEDVPLQQAFADGYHAAANQDGANLKALGLVGSTKQP